MKKSKIFPAVVLTVLTMLVFTSVAYAKPQVLQSFFARLTGKGEVPLRATQARGIANFELMEGEAELSYSVNVSNISNVFAAHIHCGAVGVNGPVGVTLFAGTPGGGPISGTLAQGTITAPDVGNGCGWADLAAVVAAINSGNTYVNVHTNDGVAPTNTGPGDFPGGEIRGQIEEFTGGDK
jgi:hypothetical protein